MDSYANQATSLLHFSGHYRQRGSGFGALAAGIGRVALPLARRFILPTAKRIGKELLKQSVPEILDVVGSEKSPKQAFKNNNLKNCQKTDRRISPKYFTSEEFNTSQATESNQQTQKNHFNAQSSKNKSVRFFC